MTDPHRQPFSSSISARSTPAHRPPRPREATSTASSSATTSPRRADPQAQPQGHHPLRRPGQRLRAGRPAVRPGDLRPGHAGPRHLLRHAARLRSLGGQVKPAKAREYGRARAAMSRDDGDLFAGVPDGDRRLDEPRRPGRSAVPDDFVPLATTDNVPHRRGRGTDAAVLRRAVPPRGHAHAARRADPPQLPLRDLRLRAAPGSSATSSSRRSPRCASRSAATA